MTAKVILDPRSPLWDGLSEEDFTDELIPEFKKELKARIEEADAHPDDGVTWQELEQKLTRKYCNLRD